MFAFAFVLVLPQLISVLLLDLGQEYLGTKCLLLRLLEEERLVVKGLVVVLRGNLSPHLWVKNKDVVLSATISIRYLIPFLL